MAAPQQKDVIYVDVDDEITGIINKLKSSESKIVALVLPKRATMLQSTVNMKLLKKAAGDDKKHLVLITSEASILPLAGSIGLYVAKTLNSKPEVPEAPIDESAAGAIYTIEDGAGAARDFDASAAADKPVGALAGLPEEVQATKAKPELTPRPIPKASDPEDTIELDNASEAAAASGAAAKAGKVKKAKKDKSRKVPNFNKFRLRLIIGAGVLVVLIVVWIIASIVLPKATIIISTKTSSINASLGVTLNTTASSLSTSSSTVPAHLQQIQKTQTQQVATTGQKNNGTAATGSVTMTAQECAPNIGNPASVPAGSGLTANNLTYITQANTTFTFSSGKGNCINFTATSATPIAAQSPGASYNTASATFNVSGRSDVNASGSANGGTDNIVQTVSQTDINNATQKLTAPDASSIKSQLQSALQQAGYYALTTTYNAGTPSTTSSAAVGSQANTVSVTQTTTYTMLGAHASDLQTLLDDNIDGQINTNKQSIQNDGLTSATYGVQSVSSTGAQLTMQATAIAGPHLSIGALTTQVAGEKPGDVKSTISANPGVTNVQVHLSPFWVSSVPKKTSKITITFQKSSNANS
jgi:hypothetical protein